MLKNNKYRKTLIALALSLPLTVGLAVTPTVASADNAGETAEQANRSSAEKYRGVKFYVKNDTAMSITLSGDKVTRTTLRPGATGWVWRSEAPSFGDDLEITVTHEWRWTKRPTPTTVVEGTSTSGTILEIDGNNAPMNAPSVSVTHKETGDYELEYFQDEGESHYMNHDRVWVKRFSDEDTDTPRDNKRFDIHIKKLDWKCPPKPEGVVDWTCGQ